MNVWTSLSDDTDDSRYVVVAFRIPKPPDKPERVGPVRFRGEETARQLLAFVEKILEEEPGKPALH